MKQIEKVEKYQNDDAQINKDEKNRSKRYGK